MMYIIRKSCQSFPRPWRVEEARPELTPQATRTDGAFEDVCEVQADGLELEYIRANFKNLPDMPENRMIRWRGDLAQFIYDHLPTRRSVKPIG